VNCEELNRKLTYDEMLFMSCHDLVDISSFLEISFDEAHRLAAVLHEEIPYFPMPLSGRSKSDVLAARAKEFIPVFSDCCANQFKLIPKDELSQYQADGWLLKDDYMKRLLRKVVSLTVESDLNSALNAVDYKFKRKPKVILGAVRRYLGSEFADDATKKQFMLKCGIKRIKKSPATVNKSPFSHKEDEFVMTHSILESVKELHRSASTIKARRRKLRSEFKSEHSDSY